MFACRVALDSGTNLFIKLQRRCFVLSEMCNCNVCEPKNKLLERELKGIMNYLGEYSLFATWDRNNNKFTVYCGTGNMADELECPGGFDD